MPNGGGGVVKGAKSRRAAVACVLVCLSRKQGESNDVTQLYCTAVCHSQCTYNHAYNLLITYYLLLIVYPGTIFKK